MVSPKPNITISVDLTNPGQFFACCGLMELADRMWPGVEAWFEKQRFCISTADPSKKLGDLLREIVSCSCTSTLPPCDRARLHELEEKKSQVKKEKRALSKAQEAERKRLNSLRIFAGFVLGTPFDLRVDWWLDDTCNGDDLKTWSGQQAVGEIAEAIKQALSVDIDGNPFDYEAVICRPSDGNAVAPLSFDPGRAGTAQDIGYSPDKIGQDLTAYVWTEFLCLVSLQRFAVAPIGDGVFRFSAWSVPLPPICAAPVAKGLIPSAEAASGVFRLAARDTGKRYKAFTETTSLIWRLL
jgi:CRISPR-associated protein Csb3